MGGLLVLGLELLLLEPELLLGRLGVEGLVLLVLPRLLVREVTVRHEELVVHLVIILLFLLIFRIAETLPLFFLLPVIVTVVVILEQFLVLPKGFPG